MAFFTVYFDDSGTHPESSVALAACFISSIEQWKLFERDWKQAEEEEGFKVFHMAEFAAKRGQFAKWNKKKRSQVLARLCGIIGKRVFAGISVAVRKSDYEEIVTGKFRSDHCGKYHYTFVVRSCCGFLGKFRNLYYPQSSMRYVFDWMGKGKGEIQEILNASQVVSKFNAPLIGVNVFEGYSFEKRENVSPLQAADIFAWTCFQQTQRIASGRKLDWLAEEAESQIRSFHCYLKTAFHTKDGLRRWAAEEQAALKELGFYS